MYPNYKILIMFDKWWIGKKTKEKLYNLNEFSKIRLPFYFLSKGSIR